MGCGRSRGWGRLLLAGALISLATFGVRAIFGLFAEPLGSLRGWSREAYGLAVAVQNLCWGLFQPLAGALAQRLGPAPVLGSGILLLSAGLLLAARTSSPWLFTLTAGVLVGAGLAGASFQLVNAGFGRLLPPARLSFAFGLATAAASLGQFIYAPLTQMAIDRLGSLPALDLLAWSLLLVLPLAWSFREPRGQRPQHRPVTHQAPLPLTRALRHPGYRWLTAGFFVCGFHVGFISTHWPADLVARGVDPTVAAWALGLVGLFNVAGSLAAGWLAPRFGRRRLLMAIYLARAAVFLAYLAMPKTAPLVLFTGMATGLLWLATVAPTTGLVAVIFGPTALGTLFGFVFLGHQLGAFLAVWLAGAIYDRVGSYDAVWWLAIALSLLAALLHRPIRERPAQPVTPTARRA